MALQRARGRADAGEPLRRRVTSLGARNQLGAYRRALAALLPAASLICGCGAARPSSYQGISRTRLAETRPVGATARFRPPDTGVVASRCTAALGARIAAHVELFAENRVVIVAGGIGARAPWRLSDGRLTRARCYGGIVTLEATGVVLVRPGAEPPLSALFRAWGQPLSTSQLASFRAAPGTHVTAFVNGSRWRGTPGSVPITPHAEIVLEVGPYVRPHTSYAFAPGS